MKLLSFVKAKASDLFGLIKRIPLVIKLVIVVALAAGVWFGRPYILATSTKAVQYVTAKAEKGTLVKSISASGTITSGNSTSINTKVSGVVETVYVNNGDAVTKGQKIAEITLDDYAKERQSSAWVKYLEATEAVKTAQKERVSADLAMWKDRQAILDAEDDVNYMNSHKGENPDTKKAYTVNEETVIVKTLAEARLAFTADESKYVDAGADISNAQTKVGSTLREYQENSSTIVAPASGIVSDLTLASGFVVSASSTTSNTSGATIVSTQSIGKINDAAGQLMASVSLTEVDITSVKANQKVTMTLDAYEDKTFTGKVLSVNTSGNVSSGVTSYPVTILLDPVNVEIYPNMAVNADIITDVKNDVIVVDSTAVTTTNGESSVQVKKDNKVTTVKVETGISNDSQTEIISGINEGDDVVTSVVNATSTSQTSTNTTSPFSGLGGGSSSSKSSSGGMPAGGPPGGF